MLPFVLSWYMTSTVAHLTKTQHQKKFAINDATFFLAHPKLLIERAASPGICSVFWIQLSIAPRKVSAFSRLTPAAA